MTWSYPKPDAPKPIINHDQVDEIIGSLKNIALQLTISNCAKGPKFCYCYDFRNGQEILCNRKKIITESEPSDEYGAIAHCEGCCKDVAACELKRHIKTFA